MKPENPNAVNLHLDAGLMGGATDSSDDSSSEASTEQPAVTTAMPAETSPAANFDAASDDTMSFHIATDDAMASQEASTQAPELAAASTPSYYENFFHGDDQQSTTAMVVETTKAPASSDDGFTMYGKQSDAPNPFEDYFGSNAVASTTVAAPTQPSVENTASEGYPDILATYENSEPATTTAQATVASDSSSFSSDSSADASQMFAIAATAESNVDQQPDDAVSAMRRMLTHDSLLQQKKAGGKHTQGHKQSHKSHKSLLQSEQKSKHLISIKLHRGL